MSGNPGRRLLALALSAVAFLAPAASHAQREPDSATCASRLRRSTADSIELDLRLWVHAFDMTQSLPPSYAEMVAEGVRQFMVLPMAIPADVYDGRSGHLAGPVIQGEYRAFLHHDGHLTQGRVVGGTLNPVFDGAILRAIVGLDSSLMLPPLDSLTLLGEDSVDVDIVLGVGALPAIRTDPERFAMNLGTVPLIRIRLPQREVTKAVSPAAGNMPPIYPPGASRVLRHGEVSIQFVVRADGKPDMRTAEPQNATAPAFVTMALEALQHYHYTPLHVEGCAVPGLVVQPFEFRADTSDHTGGGFR